MKTFRFKLRPFTALLISLNSKACINAQLALFLFSFFASFSLIAQNPQEKAIYDSLTYYYSQNAEWDSVIDIGKESIYKGYDFYSLRMRMGNAYDKERNFRLAEKNYSLALEFKPQDPNAAFYQYQAAINGGRQDVAYHLYKDYNKNQKLLLLGGLDSLINNRLPAKLKTLEQISVFTGLSFTNNHHKADEILVPTPGVIYAESLIRTNQFYANAGLKGNITPSLTWNFVYNYNQINGEYLFREKNYPLESKKISTKQNEILGGLSYYAKNGWSFSAYGLYFNKKREYFASHISQFNYYIVAENDSILGTNPDFNENHKKHDQQSFVTGIKIKKTINILDLSAFATYSDYLSDSPYQFGAEVTILPNGNYDFYLTNRLSYLEILDKNHWIYKVSAGGKAFKDLSFYASATFGNLIYSNELDLGVIYNLTEPTNFKGDFGLSYPISAKLLLSIHYQFFQKESDIYQNQVYNFYPSLEFPAYYEPQYRESIDTYKFNEHFIYLGMVWYL